jgi:hypothetical protein
MRRMVVVVVVVKPNKPIKESRKEFLEHKYEKFTTQRHDVKYGRVKPRQHTP